MQNEAYPGGATTQRLVRSVRPRRVEFLAPELSAGATLKRLDAATQTAYLVGPVPAAGWRPWALEGLENGWELGEHYYEGATPVMRYVAGGRKVELQHADAWFMGQATYTPAEAARAWALLADALPRRFDRAVLWNTPATTGRDLWLRKIEPGRAWPVLPVSIRDLITENDGQGRIELVDHEPDEIPLLAEYDGRLMYAALAWGLPAGIPKWERGDAHTYEPQTRGRYLVRVTVPRDWPQPFGLLGIKEGRDGWRYPHAPGERFMTWVDGAELELASHCGWSFEILEALTWPPYNGKGPLDSWARALVAIREQFDDARIGPGREYALVRAALRSIVLHTIGSLHSRAHKVTRFAATPEDLPAESRRVARPEPSGGFSYPVELPAKWEAMQHPELASAIWGRARRRLLAGPGKVGALHAAGDVLAFRTDAIYVTHYQRWGDDGRAGRFRLKHHGAGPFPTPRTARELLNLRSTLPTA